MHAADVEQELEPQEYFDTEQDLAMRTYVTGEYGEEQQVRMDMVSEGDGLMRIDW